MLPCYMVTLQPLPPPLMPNNAPRMRPHKRRTTRTWLVPPMRLPRPWSPLKIIYMPHRTFSQRTLGVNGAHDDTNVVDDLDIHDYEAPPSPVPMCRHQVSWTSVSSCQQFWTPSPNTTLAWPDPPHTQTTTSSNVTFSVMPSWWRMDVIFLLWVLGTLSSKLVESTQIRHNIARRFWITI